MKKTVLQSTMILVIVSVIAKALSFIVRIMLARTLSPSAMNYYTLAAPTMVFFITLAQMGIPGALSKVIAQSDHPHQPLKVSVILFFLDGSVVIASGVITQNALISVFSFISLMVIIQTISFVTKHKLSA